MTREEYYFYYTYKGDIDVANNEELLEKIEKGIKEKEISMKYKKKPITIEAIRWNGLNLEEIKKFVGNSLIYEIFDEAWKLGKGRPMVEMKIKTLEGIMTVSEGDYIIKGVQGEFYPCKPDIFEETYEQVENEPQTNYDKITASAESLAEHLVESINMDLGGLRHRAGDGKLCATWEEAVQRTIEWLQKEAGL